MLTLVEKGFLGDIAGANIPHLTDARANTLKDTFDFKKASSKNARINPDWPPLRPRHALRDTMGLKHRRDKDRGRALEGW